MKGVEVSANRRVKKIEISMEVAGKIKRDMLIEIFRQLPEDASLVRFGEDWTHSTLCFCIQSDTFPEVLPNEQVPRLEVEFWTHRGEVCVDVRKDWPTFLSPPVDPETERLKEEHFANLKEMAAKAMGVKCTCDIAYTGEKKHKPNCALF